MTTNENYWRMTKVNWRSSTQLPKMCLICGSPIGTEVHHTNALRKGTKTKDKKREPLYNFLSSINRKKIPLCHQHHQEVHLGKYDGLSLKTIYDERLPRISNHLRAQTSPERKAQLQQTKDFKPIGRFEYKYHMEQKIIINPYIIGERPKYKYNPSTKVEQSPTIVQLFIRKFFGETPPPTP